MGFAGEADRLETAFPEIVHGAPGSAPATKTRCSSDPDNIAQIV
jgi:hypothetical protein